MEQLSKQDQLFLDLWESGFRFIDEKGLNDHRSGVSWEMDGKYEGYTIKGLMNLAARGKYKFKGLTLTPEEVEYMFNYLAYIRQLKKSH